MTATDQYPVVIVGAGPVGLTASILLSQLGVRHALFERHQGTSIHPKAIGLNQRTVEILRSAGLADDIEAAAAPRHTVGRTAWYTSFGGPTPLHGRQIAIRDAWGGGTYAEEYAQASPSGYTMLPQIRLEPILRGHAEASPLADVSFGTTVSSLSSHREGVAVEISDPDGGTRTVRAQYLIGADGGRTVAEQIGISVSGPTDLLDMVSAHFSADLSSYLPDDSCLINWFVNPDHAGSIGSGYLYHLGPWTPEGVSKEWVFACAFLPDDPERFDDADICARIIRSLGLPDLPVQLHSISHWYIQSVVADRFRQDRCFLVGDAAHRIPPWGALGLNTGIQDVYNLTWKLAAVLRDPCLSGLLASYEAERRPVALDVAEASLRNFQNHGDVVDVALGLTPDRPAEGWAALETLWSDGPAGDAMRTRLGEAMLVLDKEFHAHGAENGFSYRTGSVVFDEDQVDHHCNGADGTMPDDVLIYRPTSAPGHHLPHAWISGPEGRMSTLDLTAPGRFALIVDEHSERWRAVLDAATHPLTELIDIVEVGGDVHAGHPLCSEDGRWKELREVGGSGALLMRPDKIVAWRCKQLPDDPRAVLDHVMHVLVEPAL